VGILTCSINLPAPKERIIELITDYENLPNYLPQQLKSVKIIEKKNEGILTEDRMIFKTIFKKEITQQTLHKKISDTELTSEIVSGPAKGTSVRLHFGENESTTKVDAEIDLKLSLKLKFLQPLIKKVYKNMIIGVLYKMNTLALEQK